MNTPSTRSSTDSQTTPLKIVKLGGSLLGLPDCVERLTNLLSTLSNAVVVAGGGRAADRVRRWDESGLFSSHEAHWMAIAAMSFNSLQLAESSDRFQLVTSREECANITCQQMTPVLDVMSLLRTNDAFSKIPESWDVTSDSICVFIAREWNADLCLLKSVDPGPDPAKHLDHFFCDAAGSPGRFDWINLRSDTLKSHVVRLNLDGSNIQKTGYGETDEGDSGQT